MSSTFVFCFVQFCGNFVCVCLFISTIILMHAVASTQVLLISFWSQWPKNTNLLKYCIISSLHMLVYNCIPLLAKTFSHNMNWRLAWVTMWLFVYLVWCNHIKVSTLDISGNPIKSKKYPGQITGLILGLCPANERRCYFERRLSLAGGANLESVLN